MGPNDGIGLWRSMAARLTGGQEVAGSNPASPTTEATEVIGVSNRVALKGASFSWSFLGRIKACNQRLAHDVVIHQACQVSPLQSWCEEDCG